MQRYLWGACASCASSVAQDPAFATGSRAAGQPGSRAAGNGAVSPPASTGLPNGYSDGRAMGLHAEACISINRTAGARFDEISSRPGSASCDVGLQLHRGHSAADGSRSSALRARRRCGRVGATGALGLRSRRGYGRAGAMGSSASSSLTQSSSSARSVCQAA